MRFDVRLPAPPERLRRGPFREGAFPSPLHDEHVAPPSRPVRGYRLTQGLHVATGLAAIPLLPAKLWTVYPRLFAWRPPPHCSLRRNGAVVTVAARLVRAVRRRHASR